MVALPVEVHHLCPAHVEPGATQDMDLDGDVREVWLLHVKRRLHLDQAVPAPPALEDVHGHEHVVLREARLVDDRSALCQCAPRLLDLLAKLPILALDEDATREPFASGLANAVPAVEDRLQLGTGLEFWRVRVVNAPPELLDEAGSAGSLTAE